MLGNLSEDIAQDDSFLDGGDLFGLALDSPQTSIPVNLFKKRNWRCRGSRLRRGKNLVTS